MSLTTQERVSLILFFLVLMVLYGAEIFVLVRAIIAIARRRGFRRFLWSRPAIVLHSLAGLGLVCIAYGRFVEPRLIEVTMTTIRTPKLEDASFRIVHITDLHLDRKPHNETRLLSIIDSLNPDVIVATGDYLNDAFALPRFRSVLARLKAPLGAFAVTGNFESFRWSDLDLFSETGFRVLEEDTVAVTKRGETIGISGLNFDRAGAWVNLLADLPEERFDVFLYHMPDLIEDVSGPGVDLYLCGHTHGGQVALPWYGALITFSKFGKKYESGPYRVGETLLYVNRGLGFEPRPAPPVRFCARPEIAVFDVMPARP